MKEELKLSDVIKVLDDKLCEKITVLDIRKTTIFGDYFVIATVMSKNQMKAVVDELVDTIKNSGDEVLYYDKNPDLDWNIVDSGDFIIHLFTPKGREFYNLESLWYDLPRLNVDNILQNQNQEV